jgi:hypothetical protein
MGWEHIQAGDFRNSASELYRRVVQVWQLAGNARTALARADLESADQLLSSILSKPTLSRVCLQVVNHAYEHVLKQQPYVDGGRASSGMLQFASLDLCPCMAHPVLVLLAICSIGYATDDRYSTPYINVVRGASSALHRHHDLSLNARRKTVKVNGQ